MNLRIRLTSAKVGVEVEAELGNKKLSPHTSNPKTQTTFISDTVKDGKTNTSQSWS